MSIEAADTYGRMLRAALKQVFAESYLKLPANIQSPDWDGLNDPKGLISKLVRGANPPDRDGNNPQRLTQVQATQLAAEIEVLEQYPNDATGLSMTLLRERATGDLHLAFRGTEFSYGVDGGDWERDGPPGADGEIIKFGLALTQLNAMRSVYADWSERFGLATQRLTVSGYSLGGHLALTFAELFPSAIEAVYAFNSPSRGDWRSDATLEEILDTYNLALHDPEALFDHVYATALELDEVQFEALMVLVMTTVPSDADNLYLTTRYRWAVDYVATEFALRGVPFSHIRTANAWSGDINRVLSIYGEAQENDTQIVATAGVSVPTFPLRIEDQPDFFGTGGFVGDIGSFGHTHALTLLIDSLLVHRMYASVFGDISHEDITRVLDASSGMESEDGFGLTDAATYEADTLERTVGHLARLFLGDAWRPLDWASGELGYGDLPLRAAMHSVIELVISSRLDAPALRFESLLGISENGLATKAVTDAAIRYALWTLTPFATRGDETVYGLGERSTYLNDLSFEYLRDRASFARSLWLENAYSDHDYKGTSTFRDLGMHIVMSPDDYKSDRDQYIFGSTHGDHLLGANGRDHLYGDAGHDFLQGGEGRDFLEGGLGNDELDGGLGEDTLQGGKGFDIYYAGSGDEIVDSDGKGLIFFENQLLSGGFWSESYRRFIDASGSFSYVRSWAGLEVYGHGSESLFIRNFQSGDFGITLEQAPQDVPLLGSEVAERIIVSDDRQSLRVGELPDDPKHIFYLQLRRPASSEDRDFGTPITGLDAGAGDDIILLAAGGEGELSLLGGAGHDFIGFEGRSSTGLVAYGGADHDRLQGSAGDDQLYGEEGQDSLEGGGGHDILHGGIGADRLSGGDGNDLLLAGRGYDLLLGGADSDTLVGSGDANKLFGDTHSDLILWLDGVLKPALNFSYFVGGSSRVDGYWSLLQDVHPDAHGDDLLLAGAGDDELFGGGGQDRLHGELGNDLLVGEAGDDQLFGGAGDDRLFGDWDFIRRLEDGKLIPGMERPALGGLNTKFNTRDYVHSNETNGHDYLYGGLGDDLLWGGAGDDTYFFRSDDGLDQVFDSAGWDRLLLGGEPERWRMHPDHNDLVVRPLTWIGGLRDDAVILKDWFVNATTRVEEIMFADGVRWTEADIRARIPEQQFLLANLRNLGTGRGSYYTTQELLAKDQAFVLEDIGGFDWVSLRSPDVVDAAGNSLGRGRTSIESIRREGNTLTIGIDVSPANTPSAELQGVAIDATFVANALPLVALGPQSFAAFKFELELKNFFTADGRIEVIMLDELTLGGESAPPVPGTVKLEAYAPMAQAWTWRLPEGAFVEERTDLFSYEVTGDDGAPLPSWLKWDPANLVLSSARTPEQAAWYSLEVRATDLSGNTSVRGFTLPLGVASQPSFVDLPDALAMTLGGDATIVPISWRVTDINPNESFTTEFYNAAGQRISWITLDEAAGTVRLRPSLFHTGNQRIEVRVVDGDGLVAKAQWQLNITLPAADAAATERLVIGTDGAEQLHGGAGADFFRGGRGNDTLYTGGGDDVIHMSRSDGIDTVFADPDAHMQLVLGDVLSARRLHTRIEAASMATQGFDLLVFEEPFNVGVRLPNLFTTQQVWIEGLEHRLAVLEAPIPNWTIYDLRGQQVTLEDHLMSGRPNAGLPWFKPYTGTPNLNAWPSYILPNDASETITTGTGPDVIYAGAGDDWVSAGDQADILYGQAGDDQLLGGADDDALFGGEGDDRLMGEGGNDRYWVSAHSGHDYIIDPEGSNELAIIGDVPLAFTAVGKDALLSWSSGSVLIERALAREGIARVAWYADDAKTLLRSQDMLALAADFGWQNLEPQTLVQSFSLRVSTQSAARSLDLSRYFSDPEGEQLRYSLMPVGSKASELGWLNLDQQTGQLHIANMAEGFWRLDILAQDSFNGTARLRVVLDVKASMRWLGSSDDDVASAPPSGGALYGFGGNDVLKGGGGNDLLDGGPGQDVLLGGEGSDTFTFSADRRATAAEVAEALQGRSAFGTSLLAPTRWVSLDVYDGGPGWDAFSGSAQHDLVRLSLEVGAPGLHHIESVRLGAGADILEASATSGALSVSADSGDDVIFTGAGHDHIESGAGDDYLYAGAGNDTLWNTGGTDWLDGGAGDDTYVIDPRTTSTVVDSAGDDVMIWRSDTSNLVTRLLAGRAGDDLLLQDAWDATDVRVAGWFADTDQQIETLIRSDGATLGAGVLNRWLADRAFEALAEAPRLDLDLDLLPLPELLWAPPSEYLPGVLS